jgi:hypothetical protein
MNRLPRGSASTLVARPRHPYRQIRAGAGRLLANRMARLRLGCDASNHTLNELT